MASDFDDLRLRHTGATRDALVSGAGLITLPEFQIPGGWNKRAVTVRFIEPMGYPLACPDCFWVDSDLRLASGATPQNTGFNPIPETQLTGLLWFSWHVNERWNPNRDNLLTWVACISERFRKLQ